MVGAPTQGTAMLGPLVGAHSGEMGFIADRHQRNAVIGHTLGVIEGQLDLLRWPSSTCPFRRSMICTLVCPSSEVHKVSVWTRALLQCRQRTGIEYTMTLVTQEKELHVLGSAAVTFRTISSQASTLPEVSNMSAPLLLLLPASNCDVMHAAALLGLPSF